MNYSSVLVVNTQTGQVAKSAHGVFRAEPTGPAVPVLDPITLVPITISTNADGVSTPFYHDTITRGYIDFGAGYVLSIVSDEAMDAYPTAQQALAAATEAAASAQAAASAAQIAAAAVSAPNVTVAQVAGGVQIIFG